MGRELSCQKMIHFDHGLKKRCMATLLEQKYTFPPSSSLFPAQFVAVAHFLKAVRLPLAVVVDANSIVAVAAWCLFHLWKP